MGNIKIELDIPDFDNELNISVTIKKDGEVVSQTSIPSSPSKSNAEKPKLIKTKSAGGNMMNLNI